MAGDMDAVWPAAAGGDAGSVALPPATSGTPAIVLPALRSVAFLRIPWRSSVASTQATGVRTKLAGADGLSHRTHGANHRRWPEASAAINGAARR
jgi:hypothetical protein